ncbi:hypothetical protein AB2B41_10110 [Marimonas sp. MJW-29]|uniref:Lectin-like protein BA14k n=1 Tax=Sulfitobacter sediminis TaxID=3234186 RepID=A0ABV3RLV1_9RHOB
MHRKFIATIAAASIALTALGAVPASAGERETARAIATILGLAVVGKLIHDRNERKKERRQEYHAPVYDKHGPKVQHHTPRYTPPAYHHFEPRPLPQRVNRKLLPQECFRSFDTRRGKVRMFPARCLQRNYAFADRLPRQCEYVFRTPNGDRRGYEARCLRDQGYRLARG